MSRSNILNIKRKYLNNGRKREVKLRIVSFIKSVTVKWVIRSRLDSEVHENTGKHW